MLCKGTKKQALLITSAWGTKNAKERRQQVENYSGRRLLQELSRKEEGKRDRKGRKNDWIKEGKDPPGNILEKIIYSFEN